MTPSTDRHHKVFLYQLFTWFGRGAYLIAFTSILHLELTIKPITWKTTTGNNWCSVSFHYWNWENSPASAFKDSSHNSEKVFSRLRLSWSFPIYPGDKQMLTVDMRITSLVYLLFNVLHYIIKVLLCYLFHKSAFLAVRFST